MLTHAHPRFRVEPCRPLTRPPWMLTHLGVRPAVVARRRAALEMAPPRFPVRGDGVPLSWLSSLPLTQEAALVRTQTQPREIPGPRYPRYRLEAVVPLTQGHCRRHRQLTLTHRLAGQMLRLVVLTRAFRSPLCPSAPRSTDMLGIRIHGAGRPGALPLT